MDQSDRHKDLQGDDLVELQKVLSKDGTLNDAEIVRRSWYVFTMDDKSIFDEDAGRLANAFRTELADSFYVARVGDLLSTTDSVTAYQFEATREGVERFQGPSFFEINLDDCLMFNLPVTCVVLRPGGVNATRFAGNRAFVGTMAQT